jgi:hypothetical protein
MERSMATAQMYINFGKYWRIQLGLRHLAWRDTISAAHCTVTVGKLETWRSGSCCRVADTLKERMGL